jgi:glycine/D-amino acid oxidase-like deaminating enzyme/nitrite reductase/ring-hydroxylating ferredoxin subunit
MEDHLHPSSEKFTSGTHVSFWVNSTGPLVYEKLALNKEVDAVIVGGGISGVTIAYCLSQEGKKVALVEDGFIGSGETGRTTAHLVTALDDRYYELERIFGEENAKLIAKSHASAIDFIERTVEKEKIDCDFERVSGYLFLHPSDKPESLKKEYEAALRAGLDVEQSNIVLGNKNVERVLKFNNQAQFHPLKYIRALCEAIQKNGGSIYTNTHVKEMDKTGVISDDGCKITAKNVIIATNTPVNNKFVMHLKQYPYRTYVIGAKIKKGSHPNALWWDTGDFSANDQIPPYHYVRTQNYNSTHDLLLIGGEDHPVGLSQVEQKKEEERYASLERWAKEHFHGLEEIVYKWSGQVMEPMDSLAYIGHNPMDADNIFIVTGDSGNGMTHGTIAGILIRDLVLGRDNKWKKIYSPLRFKLFKSGKTFFKEFVGGLVNYMKTKPKHADEIGLSNIKQNEGKIIAYEGKKFGAYRDEHDNMHFIDAECTHQGCEVRWNNDEKSWDCPCHGSRFTYEGQVMNGPANEPLAHYTQNKNFMHNI